MSREQPKSYWGPIVRTPERVFFRYKTLLEHRVLEAPLTEIRAISAKGNGLTGGHVHLQTMVTTIDIPVSCG
ncbi:hypothetical protein M2390_000882 [Mycetocola sp. BIGb0189]|nr:hypothetical protein [Mycetocola sp. BIGb0189]